MQSVAEKMPQYGAKTGVVMGYSGLSMHSVRTTCHNGALELTTAAASLANAVNVNRRLSNSVALITACETVGQRLGQCASGFASFCFVSCIYNNEMHV